MHIITDLRKFKRCCLSVAAVAVAAVAVHRVAVAAPVATVAVPPVATLTASSLAAVVVATVAAASLAAGIPLLIVVVYGDWTGKVDDLRWFESDPDLLQRSGRRDGERVRADGRSVAGAPHPGVVKTRIEGEEEDLSARALDVVV